MKSTLMRVAGLTLLGLAACRSSDLEPSRAGDGARGASAAEAPVAEGAAVEALYASLPEVRYYEIADT